MSADFLPYFRKETENMIILSKILTENPKYENITERITNALCKNKEIPVFICGTKDIWMRDFMPIKTKSGKYISFRYEPSYLKNDEELRTDYADIDIPISVIASNINLDGGNVVFSPSKEKAIISDRVFAENPEYKKEPLIKELENLLEAKIFIIPSLKSDLTGHTDGMVRFMDENTVIANEPKSKYCFEARVIKELKNFGFNVIPFPYFYSGSISAVGTYINYLETEKAIYLPTFGCEKDQETIKKATEIFEKEIMPIDIKEIAIQGGCLNCITWEMEAL